MMVKIVCVLIRRAGDERIKPATFFHMTKEIKERAAPKSCTSHVSFANESTHHVQRKVT